MPQLVPVLATGSHLALCPEVNGTVLGSPGIQLFLTDGLNLTQQAGQNQQQKPPQQKALGRLMGNQAIPV